MAAIDCTVVITAHMDDECLSAAGLIQKRIKEGKKVVLLNVFGRKYEYGRGEQYKSEQFSAWLDSCTRLGVVYRHHLDLEEGEPSKQSYYETLEFIERSFEKYQPTEVVIHDDQDRNQDHVWLSGVCKIALRPWAFPHIRRVLMMQSPDGLPKETNYYVEVSEDAFVAQVNAIESYARELRQAPHPRSVEHLDAWLKTHGGFCYSRRAEPYRLYFSKD